MGCCFSKNSAAGAGASARRCQPEDRSPPSPVEETVKEVLSSETPSAKLRPQPVANVAAAAKERDVHKAKKQDRAVDAAASDLGSCVSLSLATDEVASEAASESSVATSSVAGPERSPARRRRVSADLGPPRRDRAVAASYYGVRSRGSPSPPPRRSPSPVAKRPSERRRAAASPVASAQRKPPPVPVRASSGRVSPRRAQAEARAPPPAVSPPSPSQPEDDDAVTVSSEVSVPNASAGGGDVNQDDRGVDGKESLEDPLVSMECFIFL